MTGDPDRLRRQLDFLLDVDALKQVLRQTVIRGASRRENTAEHSWHLALFAMVLAEWAEPGVDITKVVEMCLVHDLVEIDAGDTFVYDDAGRADKHDREVAAAERIFALLPPDQARRFRSLWDEFEEASTPESRFANALDRLHPVMLNHDSGPAAPWLRHGITLQQARQRNAAIAQGSSALWDAASALLDDAADNGWLADEARPESEAEPES